MKQSDVVSGNAYMHMFSSAQPAYVFWSEVKSLSCVRLFATPWTVAY